jgi:hypothetical protein
MKHEKDNIFHKIDVKLMFDDNEWKSLLDGVDFDIMNERKKRKRIISKTVITERANDKRRIR